MISRHDDELIQRYLIADLDEAEREELELRLKSEPPLREVFQYYSSLTGELGDLGEPEPPADLWSEKIRPALAERLQEGMPEEGFLHSFFRSTRTLLLRPAIVLALSVAMIVGVTLVLQRQIVPGQEQGAMNDAISNIQKLREQYVAELDRLVGDMEQRKVGMSPEMRDVYERTLVTIDESIAEAERFFFAYPDNSDAIEFLFTTYEKKVEFIERFIKMEPSAPEA